VVSLLLKPRAFAIESGALLEPAAGDLACKLPALDGLGSDDAPERELTRARVDGDWAEP